VAHLSYAKEKPQYGAPRFASDLTRMFSVENVMLNKRDPFFY